MRAVAGRQAPRTGATRVWNAAAPPPIIAYPGPAIQPLSALSDAVVSAAAPAAAAALAVLLQSTVVSSAWASATPHTSVLMQLQPPAQQTLVKQHQQKQQRQQLDIQEQQQLLQPCSSSTGGGGQTVPAASGLTAQLAQSHAAPPLIAELAGLFDPGSEAAEVDPFTLYGTNFKKYEIESMQGEKVVSRSRGFTVDSCVSAVPATAETPEFVGLPTGEKVRAGGSLLCRRATGAELKPACKASCAGACAEALDAYEARLFAESGYKLEPRERARVLKTCRGSCAYECTKSGKSHDFVVPWRR